MKRLCVFRDTDEYACPKNITRCCAECPDKDACEAVCDGADYKGCNGSMNAPDEMPDGLQPPPESEVKKG